MMVFGMAVGAGAATVEIDMGMDGVIDTGQIYDMAVGSIVPVGIYIFDVEQLNGLLGFNADILYDSSQLAASNPGTSGWDFSEFYFETAGIAGGTGLKLAGSNSGDVLLFYI